jgi:hypothetical protein
MADNNENNASKRITLLPPERDFLNQFSRKRRKWKFVLHRKNDPFVIAINEWPNNIILKCLLLGPL